MFEDLIERLDPELREPIKMMGPHPMSSEDIPAARARSKQTSATQMAQAPVIKGIVTEDRIIPGAEGAPDMTIRIYRPERAEKPLPAILWMHGGGFVGGNIDLNDPWAKQLVLAADCITVLVEYRLAPEHPFPAPLEDCYTALKWLVMNAEVLGIDPSRIAVGGESAGGGLAAGLSLLARDRGELAIIFQLLIYPPLDDRNSAPASDLLPETLVITREDVLIAWRSYLGRDPGGEGVSCYAAPSRASDLTGLPSTYIAVGDLDPLAQEDIDYARRLVAAGVSTELHLYPKACHVFNLSVPNADISKRCTADISRALKKALHG